MDTAEKDIILTDEDLCVICGCYVPEGTMICPQCSQMIQGS